MLEWLYIWDAFVSLDGRTMTETYSFVVLVRREVRLASGAYVRSLAESTLRKEYP